jgi:uncharacterized heparinase superfamily protein
MRLGLYLHTLRRLRPAQLWHQVLHRCYKPAPDLRPAPSLAPLPPRWQPPIERAATLLEPYRFTFLAVERAIQSRADWNHPEWPSLWKYHLHYFEDLNRPDAPARRAWHAAWIQRWIAENPPAQGIGWEPYPTSLRIVNWIKWAYGGGALPPAAVHSLAVQARYLSRRLEKHLLANHLLANAKALCFAGHFFVGPEAARWAELGANLLAAQLPQQVLPDGGHCERSPMYHALVLEDALDLINLLASPLPAATASHRNSLPLLRNTGQAMGAWLSAMCHPDGDIAFFNDAALGLAPSARALAQYARRLGLEAWSLPRNGVTALAHSGFVRLQNAKAVLIADVGEPGPDYQPGHAHAGTLSFELSVGGQRLVVNSGTSTYEPGALRSFQRSTSAHSTVEVDEQNSTEVWAAFRVARQARVTRAVTGEPAPGEFELVGEHDGYARLWPELKHRRNWHLAPDQLLLTDELSAEGHRAQARFYLHPSTQGRWDTSPAAPRAIVTWRGGQATWRTTASEASLDAARYFPEFGRQAPSQVLRAAWRQKRATHAFQWEG